jgi:hypothetical protein
VVDGREPHVEEEAEADSRELQVTAHDTILGGRAGVGLRV